MSFSEPQKYHLDLQKVSLQTQTLFFALLNPCVYIFGRKRGPTHYSTFPVLP